jgi:uncharacterized membrane protein (DUF2068 family)
VDWLEAEKVRNADLGRFGGTLTFPAAPRQLKDRCRGEDALSSLETERMSQATRAGSEPRRGMHHDRGLLLIGLFKLGKSIFFFCVGLGAIHLLHKDLGDEVLRIAAYFHRDAENQVVSLILEKVDLIDAHRLREIGFGTFAYSALALTEGVGLLMEKVWAEYLTLGLTIAFLPWELFELARKPDWFRLGLLLINLAVLGYLVWLLQRKKKKELAAEAVWKS